MLFDASAVAKLARADEHLSELEVDMARMSDPEQMRVWPRWNEDATETGYFLEFRHGEPYLRWATIVGDVVHNLRGALDHAIYAIAAGESGAVPPPQASRLAFPIAGMAEEWKDVNNRMANLREEVQIRVEEAQPFRTRKPVWYGFTGSAT